MKAINTYIIEKLKIDKDIDADKDYDLLDYNEFLDHLHDNIMETTSKQEVRKMIAEKCFFNVKLNEYDFYYIDPEKWRNHWHYKYYIEDCETLLKDKNHEEHTLKKLYVDNIINLYVYHYVNVNLSGDNGDEHYIFFIDHMNKRYAAYEFVKKDGDKWIKKL